MQALSEARQRADRATKAAAAAEGKLAALEVGIPKARMEAESQRQLAKDLSARLTQLKAATKVRALPQRLLVLPSQNDLSLPQGSMNTVPTV